jgi:ubiquinone biosynthesis protein
MPIELPFRQQQQEVARARHIVQVLARNGLGFLIEQWDLARFAPPWRRPSTVERRAERLTIPQRLRRALEDLGPTFIKLGQMLSTRGDLLPPEYIAELKTLLDAAPPVPVDQIVPQIERELGAPLPELFADFDREPIASASIGQVHRATLPGGESVVVKAQRPGVAQVIDADLDLLLRQARFLESRSALLREYRLAALTEELSQALRDELDYVIEGRNADRFRSNFKDDPQVVIPKVYWEFTTRRVITLEALNGIKLSQPDLLRESGTDIPTMARLVVGVYLEQVFEHGFFHGDPHPANIFILSEDRIGLVDFGTVGYITPPLRDDLVDLFLALLDQDVESILRSVLKIGLVNQVVNQEALRRDIMRLLTRYYGRALEEVRMNEMMEEVFRVAFRHRIAMPPDLALLAKTLVELEGVGRSLDPQFVLAEEVRPFAQKLIAERLSLRHLGSGLLRSLRELNALMQMLPQRIDSLWSKVERGEARFVMDLQRQDEITAKLDVVANRLAFAMIVAALIVGSALIIQGGVPTWRLPLVGLEIPLAQMSFLVAGALGTWLLISILRARGL